MRSTNLNAESKWSVVVVLSLFAIAGCGGPAGPKTYPVKGQVQLAGGEVQVLAGHNVEAALEADSTVRAYGLIKDDGSFELETLLRRSPAKRRGRGKIPGPSRLVRRRPGSPQPGHAGSQFPLPYL